MQKKGKIVYELPPSKGNPRNSEGAFIELRNGKILFIFSRFIGESANDDAKSCLAAVCSTDCGTTWSGQRIILTADDDNALNIMSVSLIRMLDGSIGLFYLIRHGWNDMRLHLRKSADEGESWSAPICCMPGQGYYVANNDRVTRLSNGRLIIPAAFHRMKGESISDWKSFDGRSCGTCFFLSDDDGETWFESQCRCDISSSRTKSGLQEPGIIELQNGVLWGWARTDLGCQYEMYSFDMGDTWTAAEPSIFTSPCSPLSIKHIPSNGYLLAVWNPFPVNNRLEWPCAYTVKRTPLVCAISKDNGRTWGGYNLLEDDENSGYCYTSIYFQGDSVLLAYCAGGSEDPNCLSRLRIRKIELEEMY